MRILSQSPERYSLHLETSHPEDVPVPQDGHVSLTIPPFRKGCTVYLLGIRVSDGYDPRKEWMVEVRERGATVRRMSFRDVAKLKTDADGYRLIKVSK